WKSSFDTRGGSPGKINSVDGILQDNMAPRLLKTYSVDSINIVGVFDEPVDSMTASSISNYSFSHQINILSTQPEPPFFDRIHIRLSSPMQKGIVYELTARHISDCNRNEIGIHRTAKAGIGEIALTGDIIVNEILFNPRPNAFDFVELYNKSNKIVDISTLSIASKTSTGVLTQPKKISEKPFFLFPQEYLIVTKDKSSLQHEYLVKNPDQMITCVLPSYPDDKGTVVLTNEQGHLIDELSYSDKWHFTLISNDEGISLERIDPSSNSLDKENWHSASATAGFGTPTYQNSQYKQTDVMNGEITINSKIISPDNDGLDDFLTINYELETPGYLANVNVFNSDGRLVLRFKKNELLGVKGSWQWDGSGENKHKLQPGIYIFHTEIFNLKGIRKNFKNVIVLAARMN
ncbi:MAG: lamin tail domain-containing protein, partial [Flavisolibacter sp.]